MLFGFLLFVTTNPIKSLYRYREKESVGQIKSYTSYKLQIYSNCHYSPLLGNICDIMYLEAIFDENHHV